LALVVALVASFVSWRAGGGGSSTIEGPTVVRIPEDDIETIRYESGGTTLVLERRSPEEGESHVWVRHTEAEGGGDSGANLSDVQSALAETLPDAGASDRADAGTASRADARGQTDGGATSSPTPESASKRGEGEPPPKTRSYLGGEAAERLFTSFDPLSAVRTLTVDAEEETRYGLGEPRATLTVRRAGGESWTMAIGDEAYGGEHTYVRDTSSGSSFAIESSVLNALQYADIQLFEKDLTPLGQSELETIAIRKGGTRIVLHQHRAADPKKTHWTVGDDGAESPAAGAWVGKLLRLQVQSYHPEPPSSLEPAMTIELRTGSNETGHAISLFTSPSDGGHTSWYARSPHTHVHVRLDPSRASTLVDDVRHLSR
jgi:hypothetical protein